MALALAALLLGVAATPAGSGEVERGRDPVTRVREYRGVLRRALVEQTREVDRVTELVDRLRARYEHAPRAPRRLLAALSELETLRATRDTTRRHLLLADSALDEILAGMGGLERAPQGLQVARDAPARPPRPSKNSDRSRPLRSRVKATLVRYDGAARWSLARAPALERYFLRRFGRPLPVSAFGQTPVHDRLGFDHSDGLDVALHPDSREGAALVAFLRGGSIPFIAVRGAVEGSATGAHIHVGPPSARVARVALLENSQERTP
jgi:hypothetical protein